MKHRQDNLASSYLWDAAQAPPDPFVERLEQMLAERKYTPQPQQRRWGAVCGLLALSAILGGAYILVRSVTG